MITKKDMMCSFGHIFFVQVALLSTCKSIIITFFHLSILFLKFFSKIFHPLFLTDFLLNRPWLHFLICISKSQSWQTSQADRPVNIGTEIPAAPSKLVIPRSYRRIIHFDCPWADAVFVLFFLLRFCFTSLSNRDCFHFKYAIWLQLLTEKRTKAGAKCYDLYSSGVLTKKKRLVMEFSIRDNHALTIL